MKVATSVLRQAAIAMCAIAVLAPSASRATIIFQRTGRPVPQQQVRAVPVQPWHAVRTGPHVFYGTIAAMQGPVLTIRLRSGRLQAVDATPAIAHGDYSQPLFIGKVVSIDGNEVGARFLASHIFRMSNLANLAADR